MRVWDTEQAICRRLQALPRPQYLAAMWILCGQVRALYEDLLADPEPALMAATLALAKEAVTASGRPPEPDTGELAARWQALIEERGDDVPPGQWNAWVVFADLAREIGGSARPGEAAERLHHAATGRFRPPAGRGFRLVDPDEEVDDLSPMAQTLARFERIVEGVEAGEITLARGSAFRRKRRDS